jgi:adenylosuccinate synthase
MEKLYWLRDHLCQSGYLDLAEKCALPQEKEWLTNIGLLQNIVRLYEAWPGKAINTFPSDKVMVFEGAQGVLLDEIHGTAPYNTWTDCTFGNAMRLLRDCHFNGEVTKVGCFRSYFTRHGAGPFPTERKSEEMLVAEKHNCRNTWQGRWRVGSFDVSLAKKAIAIVGGIDEIALSHTDVQKVHVDALEICLGVPIKTVAAGPTAEHRWERKPMHAVTERADAGTVLQV